MARSRWRAGVRDRSQPVSPSYGQISCRDDARRRQWAPPNHRRGTPAERRYERGRVAAVRGARVVPRRRGVSAGVVRGAGKERRMKSQITRLLLFAAIVGCSRPPGPSNAQQSASGRVAPGALPTAQISATRQNAITKAVATISPSVVTVQTEQVNQAPQDPFDMFFGR